MSEEKSEGGRWSLEGSEEQMQLIIQCLELVFRLRIGQFDLLSQELRSTPDMTHARSGDMVFNELHDVMKLLSATVFPGLNTLGVGSDERANKLWDVYYVLRNTIARSKLKPGDSRWQVIYDDPHSKPYSGLPPVVVKKEA